MKSAFEREREQKEKKKKKKKTHSKVMQVFFKHFVVFPKLKSHTAPVRFFLTAGASCKKRVRGLCRLCGTFSGSHVRAPFHGEETAFVIQR